MLPRWHVLYGAVFTLILYVFAPQIGLLNLMLVFLASFLIDFDHYIYPVYKTGSWSLKNAFKYVNMLIRVEEQEQKKRIYRKGPLMIFHTIEFHILVALLGLLWEPFFWIFIGMIFHSLLDLYDQLRKGRFYRREWFFFNWLRKQVS